MTNELTLDAADFSDMVSQWKDGGNYYVTLNITQTGNDGKTFTATVDEVTDYGDLEMEEPATPPAKIAKTPPKTPAKVMVNAKATPAAY